MAQPEDQARQNIDRMLSQAGWSVCDSGEDYISAFRGLAIRNFTLKQGHGFADYLLGKLARTDKTLVNNYADQRNS